MNHKLATNYPEGYNEKRNFVQLFPEFVRERDFYSYCVAVIHRLTGKGFVPLLRGMFYKPFAAKGDKLYHFFNTTSFNKSPWIVTFETAIPRLGEGRQRLHNKAAKKLAGDSCKKIIAMSKSAYELQLVNLKNNYPQYAEVIESKMMILHPAQELLVKDYSEKKLQIDKIVFTIVGADFFRKGGREVLNVFDKLIPQHSNLFLKIISSMQYGDYASKTNAGDLENARRIIEKYPDNIKLYSALPNNEVLEALKETHVGLLPTWGDSYGYSVLESQAAGCPMITTDLRALTEINDDQIGWNIKVPQLANKNGDIKTSDKRKMFANEIEINLEKIILAILANPAVIEEKGKLSLEKIQKMHNVKIVKKALKNIYSTV